MRLRSDHPKDVAYLDGLTWAPGTCDHSLPSCGPEVTQVGDMAICRSHAEYRLLLDRLDANARWSATAPEYRPNLAATAAPAA